MKLELFGIVPPSEEEERREITVRKDRVNKHQNPSVFSK
jgi:hypothetical protein